jgi:hypothetical protein
MVLPGRVSADRLRDLLGFSAGAVPQGWPSIGKGLPEGIAHDRSHLRIFALWARWAGFSSSPAADALMLADDCRPAPETIVLMGDDRADQLQDA